MTKRTGRILPSLLNPPPSTRRLPTIDSVPRSEPLTPEEEKEEREYMEAIAIINAEEAAATAIPLGAHRHVEPRSIHSEPKKPWKRRLVP